MERISFLVLFFCSEGQDLSLLQIDSKPLEHKNTRKSCKFVDYEFVKETSIKVAT